MADITGDFWLSDTELAERYSVSRQTIWKWVRIDPLFPRPVRLSPGCTRFSSRIAAEWERSKAEASAAPKTGEAA